MAQFLQNFADKLPHLAQRMLRGNAPFRVDVREHPALIEKSSTHRKSSRRISGKSESPPLHSGEVFPQTAKRVYGHIFYILHSGKHQESKRLLNWAKTNLTSGSPHARLNRLGKLGYPFFQQRAVRLR